jgi:hypothetical protein
MGMTANNLRYELERLERDANKKPARRTQHNTLAIIVGIYLAAVGCLWMGYEQHVANHIMVGVTSMAADQMQQQSPEVQEQQRKHQQDKSL